jgi:poly(hydroxyalkanoate) granule-associated protein
METTTGSDKNKQDELKDSVHRIWLAGLGALAAAEEEGSKLFSRLVDRGRDVEVKGKVEVDKVNEKVRAEVDRAKAKAESAFDGWSEKLDEKLNAALHRLGVPTRDEIHNLTQRVEELNAKVEQLKPRVTPASPVVTPGSPEPVAPSKIVV